MSNASDNSDAESFPSPTTDANPLVSRIEIVPIRQAFQREASHFTRWLETQIEALSERVGIQLTVIQREKDVGDFKVDLLCEDSNRNLVIIENQLEKTDHTHLGQVLTYLVNLEAGTAIWIATELRPEHKKVIDWLNESTPANISFYLVKVEAIRIQNSPFAPLFTVLAKPDIQAKVVGENKKELAGRYLQREAFWRGLLERSRTRTTLFSTISPTQYSFLSTGAGRSGLTFVYSIRRDGAEVSFYIDADQDTGIGNKRIFEALLEQKETIEAEFGGPLEWDKLETRRASVIRKLFTNGGWALPDTWPDLYDQMIEAMVKLDSAIRPKLANIRNF